MEGIRCGRAALTELEYEPMHLLEMDCVGHRYGLSMSLSDITFSLEQGMIGCLMGPSGSGKSTVLSCIAGLEPVAEGNVRLKGKVASSGKTTMAPEKRRIGMLFQEFALFPHLTVEYNIAFGLGRAGGNGDRKRIVREMVELFDLERLRDRYPHELSGGQQQRSALARALAPNPDLLLLDEPFSSLEEDLRERLLAQVRDILKQRGITALMVTHNQSDALSFADVAGVINEGVICQWDTVYNLYYKPSCLFVANFVGRGVLLRGKLVGANEVETELGRIRGESGLQTPLTKVGDAVMVLVRPDYVVLEPSGGKLRARITHRSFRGANIFYTLSLPSGEKVYSNMPSSVSLETGSDVGIRTEFRNIVLFPGVA